MPASPQQYLMENMIKQKTVGTKNGTLFWYNVTMDMNAKTSVRPGVEVEPGALCLSVRVSLPDPTQKKSLSHHLRQSACNDRFFCSSQEGGIHAVSLQKSLMQS